MAAIAFQAGGGRKRVQEVEKEKEVVGGLAQVREGLIGEAARRGRRLAADPQHHATEPTARHRREPIDLDDALGAALTRGDLVLTPRRHVPLVLL